jgi:phosphatidylserine decarboxylase
VMLWPRGPLQFDSSWAPGKSVRLGEAMAQR